MKRVTIIFLMLFLSLGLTGCKKNSEDVNQDSVQGVEDAKEAKGTKAAKEAQEDLKENSKELALQMAEGNFHETYQSCSTIVKLQMSEADLKKAWDSTVEGLGTYLDVYDITQDEVDGYQKVDVILQYENSGLKISFTYNDSMKIDGLWINYASIEEKAASTDVYSEVEITFGGEEYPITGLLTLPKDVINPPVAILVPGSGNHDKNEYVGANKPFQDIARGLAEQGIASIRYNERIMLYPELANTGLTIETDSLKDASDAIAYAISCDKINKDKVFVIGHSLGAMMAPKIATDRPEVAGIVLLAGSPRKLEDIILDQVQYAISRTDNVTKEQAEEAMATTKEGIAKIQDLKQEGSDIILGYPSCYWYSLNQINVGALATNLEIPIYIAQGSADFQVFADKDYVEWQQLLKDKDNVTFKLYNNLNHLFMTTNGKTDITEYNTPGHVDQTVIDDISDWITNY